MKTSVCSAGGGGCGGEPPCIPGTGKEMTCKNRRRPPIGLQIINAPDASMAGGGVLTPSVNSVPVVSMSSRQGGFGVNQKQMEIRGPLRKKAPSVFPKAHLPVSTICTPHPCPGHHPRLLAPSVRKGTRLPCQLPGNLETRFSHPPCFQGVMEHVTLEPVVPSLIKKPKKKYWVWFVFCHPRVLLFFFPPRPCPNSRSLPGSLALVFSRWCSCVPDASKMLPRGLCGKKPACQGRRPGFNPWVGKIHCRRKWQPTPIFLPGESHGQRSLVGLQSHGVKERYD